MREGGGKGNKALEAAVEMAVQVALDAIDSDEIEALLEDAVIEKTGIIVRGPETFDSPEWEQARSEMNGIFVRWFIDRVTEILTDSEGTGG